MQDLPASPPLGYFLADIPASLLVLVELGEVPRSLLIAFAYAFPNADDVRPTREVLAAMNAFPFVLPPLKTRATLRRHGIMTSTRMHGIPICARTVGTVKRVRLPRLPPDLMPVVGGKSRAEWQDWVWEHLQASLEGRLFDRPAARVPRVVTVIPDPKIDGRWSGRRVSQIRWEARTMNEIIRKLAATARRDTVVEQADVGESRANMLRAWVNHCKSGQPVSPDASVEETARIALGAHIALTSAFTMTGTPFDADDVRCMRAFVGWVGQVVNGKAPVLPEDQVDAFRIRRLANGNGRQLAVDMVMMLHSKYSKVRYVRAAKFFQAGFNAPSTVLAGYVEIALNKPWRRSGELDAGVTLQDVLDNFAKRGEHEFPPHPTHASSVQGKAEALARQHAEWVASKPAPVEPKPAPVDTRTEEEKAQTRAGQVAMLLRERASLLGGEDDVLRRMISTIVSYTAVEADPDWSRSEWGADAAVWTHQVRKQFRRVVEIDEALWELGERLSLISVPDYVETARAGLSEDAAWHVRCQLYAGSFVLTSRGSMQEFVFRPPPADVDEDDDAARLAI